jgi:hypothetical protein
MNNLPGLVRINDHVVYEVAGRQRYGIIQEFQYRDGEPDPFCAVVQPALGGPRIWLDLGRLTPVSAR